VRTKKSTGKDCHNGDDCGVNIAFLSLEPWLPKHTTTPMSLAFNSRHFAVALSCLLVFFSSSLPAFARLFAVTLTKSRHSTIDLAFVRELESVGPVSDAESLSLPDHGEGSLSVL
jgi:hypothetical protein